MSYPRITGLLATLGISSVILLSIGIAVYTRTTPVPTVKQQVVFCFDRSISARSLLPAFVFAASRSISQLDPQYTQIFCYRLDNKCCEFYLGTPVRSREAAASLIVKYVAEKPKAPKTFPLLFWQEIERRFSEANKPTLIVFYTDGENDDQSPETQQKLSRVIMDLARNLNLRITLVGIRPERRAELRTLFQPFGDRFTIKGLEQSDVSELNAF